MEYVIKCCDGSGCDECTSDDEDNDSVCFRVRHEYNEKECSDNCPYKHEDEEDEEDIVFKCAECDRSIVRNSNAHDNCFTHNGARWWCEDCHEAFVESDDDKGLFYISAAQALAPRHDPK